MREVVRRFIGTSLETDDHQMNITARAVNCALRLIAVKSKIPTTCRAVYSLGVNTCFRIGKTSSTTNILESPELLSSMFALILKAFCSDNNVLVRPVPQSAKPCGFLQYSMIPTKFLLRLSYELTSFSLPSQAQ